MRPSPAIPCATFSVPGVGPVVLLAGDTIGRSASCELHLSDPRVSELHAFVSLRGAHLVMFPLRGRLAVDGALVRDVRLAPGVTVALARDLALTCTDVVLPRTVMQLEVDGLPPQLLTTTCSLVWDPTPSLAPGVVPGAPLAVWPDGGQWYARTAADEDQRLVDGMAWQFAEGRARVVEVALAQVGLDPTCTSDGVAAPLRLRAKYDSVVIDQDGEVALVLSGIASRLVCELIAFDGPVKWAVLARELWGDVAETSLRKRLDVALYRMRQKLSSAGVRRDLVRPDGCGCLELVLGPQDVVLAEF